MSNGLFITARTNSSRLPNKILENIWGFYVLEILIHRAKQVINIDKIVLCTSSRGSDNIIAKIAKKEGIYVYRGSLEDKLDRWLGAAKTFDITNIVNMDGDDVLTSIELMNEAVLFMKHCDVLKAPSNIVCGAFTEAFSTEALEYLVEHKDTTDTEYTTEYFSNPNLKIETLPVPDIFLDKEIRLTLDYKEDLDLFKTIFNHFNNTLVSLYDVIPYVLEKDLNKINWFRQKDYLYNQKGR